MGSTNKTTTYKLPQWIGSDKPTFLGDFNDAFLKIDEGMTTNKNSATTAEANAENAVTLATKASNDSKTAASKADTATTTATNAANTANQANTTANKALTLAENNQEKINNITDYSNWIQGTLSPSDKITSFTAGGISYNPQIKLLSLYASFRSQNVAITTNDTLFNISSNLTPYLKTGHTIYGCLNIRDSGGEVRIEDIKIVKVGDLFTIQFASATSIGPDPYLSRGGINVMINTSGW